MQNDVVIFVSQKISNFPEIMERKIMNNQEKIGKIWGYKFYDEGRDGLCLFCELNCQTNQKTFEGILLNDGNVKIEITS